MLQANMFSVGQFSVDNFGPDCHKLCCGYPRSQQSGQNITLAQTTGETPTGIFFRKTFTAHPPQRRKPVHFGAFH